MSTRSTICAEANRDLGTLTLERMVELSRLLCSIGRLAPNSLHMPTTPESSLRLLDGPYTERLRNLLTVRTVSTALTTRSGEKVPRYPAALHSRHRRRYRRSRDRHLQA